MWKTGNCGHFYQRFSRKLFFMKFLKNHCWKFSVNFRFFPEIFSLFGVKSCYTIVQSLLPRNMKRKTIMRCLQLVITAYLNTESMSIKARSQDPISRIRFLLVPKIGSCEHSRNGLLIDGSVILKKKDGNKTCSIFI